MRLDKTLVVGAACWATLILATPAWAYIDPGTGSLIYQTVLTLLLGVGLMVRRSRAAIARFVQRIASPSGKAADRD